MRARSTVLINTRHLAVVAVTLIAALALACTSAAPPSIAPTAGEGWRLVQTRQGGPVREGVAVAPLGPDAYLVAITVPAGGSGGCGTPTFVGFDQSGSTLVGSVTRSPLGSGTCAVTGTTTFFVELDRLTLPNGVSSIAVSDTSCKESDCLLPSAPIPSQSGWHSSTSS